MKLHDQYRTTRQGSIIYILLKPFLSLRNQESLTKKAHCNRCCFTVLHTILKGMRSLVAISAFSKKLYKKSHPHQSDESVFERRFLLVRAIPGQSVCVGISYVLSRLGRSGALEQKLKEFKELLQTKEMYNTKTIKSLDPSYTPGKV